MSERHSVGDYNIEISGRELVVRDHGGDVVETIDLAEIGGAFSLPDGQTVDVASLILSEEPDVADFETAAGPANENDPSAATHAPASFRAFVGDNADFAPRGAAGALDDTSLAYGAIDDQSTPDDQRLFGEDAPTIPVNWSHHDEWRISENQAGGEFGRLVEGDPQDFTFKLSDDRFDIVDGILQLKDEFSFDFETESFIEVEVTATSKTGETRTQSVHIDVIDENEGQISIDLDNALVTENVTGAVIGKITVSDPDAGDSQAFLLSDSRFEVVGGDLRLKDGVSLDHESEPTVDVTVTATDKGGNSISQTFTIVVGNVNEAQTALSLDSAMVEENAAGAVIGALSVADPDAGDSQTFTVSDNRFEVVNGQLKLKDGVSMDFETESSIGVTVTATDKGGSSISENFTIAVGDVNEAQTALSLNGAYVAENAAGAVIGALNVIDPDAADTQTFAVSDGRFEVVNGQLKLKDGVSLDFEAEPTVNVTVTATDKSGHSISEQFTLGVGNVNEAPLSLDLVTTSDQLLVNGSFEADKLNNGQWKLFSGIDGWKTDTQVEIQNNVTNKASNGTQVVELDADKAVDNLHQDVKTTAGHVYELTFDTATRKDTKHTDTIEVYWNGVKVGSVDPQSTAWQTSTFQVVGTGGNDRLEFREVGGKNDSYGGLLDNVSLKGMGSSVAENFAGVVIGALEVTDPDAGDTHDFAVSDSRFEVVDGHLKLKDGVSFDYETEPAVNVTVTATDSAGHSIQQSFAVNVTNLNEAPVASVQGGSVENHIVNTTVAFQSTSDTIGDYLLTGSNGTNAVNKFGGAQINGIDPKNVTLTVPTEVSITFQREGAGHHNMVGVYQFDDAGKVVPGSVKFVWLDATAVHNAQLGSALAKNFLGFQQPGTVSLGVMEAGAHLGFFTIANGAGSSANQTLLKALAGNAADLTAAMDAINSKLSVVIDSSGNGHIYAGDKQLSGDTYFTHDKALNTDFGAGKDIQHSLSGTSATLDGKLVVGFEDLNGGGDRDYEDVVFSVSMGSYNVNKMSQSVVQPTVDFADIDSQGLHQAVIQSSGFQAGDMLNLPPSGLFNVNVQQSGNDYLVTITGKTGGETVDQYESFVNSIYFSTSSKAEGDRHIDYKIVDEGGLSSNIAHSEIGVANSFEISSSKLAANQTALGSGDDDLYLNSNLTGHLDFGDGYDTLHIARNNENLGHSDAAKLSNVEAIDATGYGTNKVALSIVDVLDMTDNNMHLTVVGDKGDTVTLSGDNSGHHWSVAETNADFTTYVWSDPVHQAVVEISNQLTATLSS